MPILRNSSLCCHAGNAIGVNRLHSKSPSSALAPFSIAVLSAILMAASSGPFASAADDAPVADTSLPQPVAAPSATAAPAFQPEDISIAAYAAYVAAALDALRITEVDVIGRWA